MLLRLYCFRDFFIYLPNNFGFIRKGPEDKIREYSHIVLKTLINGCFLSIKSIFN